MAPVVVWVVDTGIPNCVAMKMASEQPVSAQKPPKGRSLVRRMPMVFTIRQPPAMVPSPMAAWHASTIHRGKWFVLGKVLPSILCE